MYEIQYKVTAMRYIQYQIPLQNARQVKKKCAKFQNDKVMGLYITNSKMANLISHTLLYNLLNVYENYSFLGTVFDL